MNYLSGLGRRGCFVLKPAQSAAILLAVVSAGCSADVARFDSSSFKLNDPPETVAAAPPPAPVRSGSDFNNPVTRSQPRGPYGAGAKSVEVAALPDATPSTATPYQAAPASPRGWHTSPTGAPITATPIAMAAPVQQAVASGESIDVQQGDTLYGLSKRHHVSVAELMSVNQLTSPNLKPGQKLVLPSGNSSQKPLRHPVEAAAKTMAPPAAEVAAKYNSTYTVKPGDSLYAIARANKVPYGELQQVNGITDPRKVRPGTVLKMPAGLGAAAAAAAAAEPAVAAAQVAPAVAPVTEAPRAIQSTTQPTSILNGGKKVAALSDKATDSVAPAAAAPAPAAKVAAAAPQAAAQATDSSKLRWPVSGKVIAGFGGRPDGTHNDGVNLSVPLGTEVHAAENGIVAYAGSELKGYGNLVLVRHDNGWVTAYAHNDELLVKRGDKVKRGQVIGKAGKTGTVDQPQVHFELRQGSKPVDPTPFMEKS